MRRSFLKKKKKESKKWRREREVIWAELKGEQNQDMLYEVPWEQSSVSLKRINPGALQSTSRSILPPYPSAPYPPCCILADHLEYLPRNSLPGFHAEFDGLHVANFVGSSK